MQLRSGSVYNVNIYQCKYLTFYNLHLTFVIHSMFPLLAERERQRTSLMNNRHQDSRRKTLLFALMYGYHQVLLSPLLFLSLFLLFFLFLLLLLFLLLFLFLLLSLFQLRQFLFPHLLLYHHHQ